LKLWKIMRDTLKLLKIKFCSARAKVDCNNQFKKKSELFASEKAKLVKSALKIKDEENSFTQGTLNEPSAALPSIWRPLESKQSTSKCLNSSIRSVKFDKVVVREYGVVVCVNPSVSDGLAISRGWDYTVQEAIDIDIFEAKQCSGRSKGKRHDLMDEMKLRYDERLDILVKGGVSNKDIKKTVRKTKRARSKRIKSLRKQYEAGEIRNLFLAADIDVAPLCQVKTQRKG